MNNGAFDGGQSTANEKELHQFYKTLFRFSGNSLALTGSYREIHSYNREHTAGYNDKVFSFVRWKGNDRLIVLCNFSSADEYTFQLKLDPETVALWKLEDGTCELKDILTGSHSFKLNVTDGLAYIELKILPLQSFVFVVE
jgi:hypothetical protein